MGFQLGRALGKLAGSAVRSVTHGLVRPTFSKPARLATAPDSTVTTTGFFPWMTRTTQYPGGPSAISSYPVVNPGTQTNGGGGGQALMRAGCAMVWDGQRFRTTHPNKATYVTRGGGTSRWPQQLLVHPKGTECVTHRRMNPGNGRAVVHAVRRVAAFHALAKRVERVLHRVAKPVTRGRVKHASSCGCGCKK